ncbi:MAG TPA: Hsp20/alpha crystallin family protein [Armatimonadota bacterium]|jgi:HSP20 family protein
MDRNRGFDINALRQQMEDLLEDFIPGGAARRPAGGRPAPDQTQTLAVNLLDADGSLVLTAPLPGMQPEDIEISVRGQSLNIRAQRKGQQADRSGYIRREWGFASYQRGLELPSAVEADKATASYRHGVITITLPKADANRAQSIKIEDAEAESEAETSEAPAEKAEAPAAEILETAAVEVETAEPPAVEAAVEAPTEAQPAPSGRERSRGGFYMQRGRNRGRGNQAAKQAAAETSEAAPEGDAAVDVPVVESDAPQAAVQAPATAPESPVVEHAAPAAKPEAPGAEAPAAPSESPEEAKSTD